jgi:hypothetical protein
MKRLRLTLPLMAAIAAMLAIPGVAAAAEWTQEGKALEEPVTVQLSGSIGVTGGSIGFNCPDVTGEATLSPGDQGEITALDMGPGCPGTGGLNGATAAVTSVGLSWPLEARENGTVGLIDPEWYAPFYPRNPFDITWKLKASELTLTPDYQWAISSFHVGGEVEGGLAVYGSLDVDPAGVYAIE